MLRPEIAIIALTAETGLRVARGEHVGLSRGFGIAVALAATILLTATTPAAATEPTGSAANFPALTVVMDPSGAETTSTFSVAPGEYQTKDGHRLRLTAAATYTCSGKTDNPHWSAGPSSVIAKTRVTCTGPASSIPINVYSMLGRTPVNDISTLQIVATSQYTQSVQVNGSSTTWYVPSQGSGTKIPSGAYFRGSHSGQGAPPLVPFDIGAASSSFVWVD